MILIFVSERIRRCFIRILPRNRIKIEVSPYFNQRTYSL
nr:translation initiation factor 1 [Pygeum topengii]UZC55830.1 translation initiation factor 1 [Pygeum topengii]UZC57448.1 translation initiation factor 1 [Prunus sericea]